MVGDGSDDSSGETLLILVLDRQDAATDMLFEPTVKVRDSKNKVLKVSMI